MPQKSDDVLLTLGREERRNLERLKDYLRIPSISTDPTFTAEVRRCADFLVDEMRHAGLQAERIDTEGHPLVYAERLDAPGRPTVLFYGHYDVQPVDPVEEWRNPPFEPTEEGDLLVARGATDDKGQSFAHLAAVAAHIATRGSLPVNVKFLIEGEEESGGEAIEAFVRQDRAQKLACDCVVISDSSMFGPGQPSLLYGLKGLAYFEIHVRGANRDLHSGSFGGGVANPANALAQILASLQDPATGRILIPGFYQNVRPLADWERQEFAALPFDEATYCRELGIREVFGEEGYSTLERVWARPTCDVNGLFGGYQGAGAKTVLPGRAGAKVSMRLVPDQTPAEVAELLRRHVAAVAPRGVEVEVREMHGGTPVLLDVQGPIVEAALLAMEESWGKRPVKVREGGTIPIVSTFVDVLDVPVLLLGFGLSDDRLHAPNEKINLSQFFGGIRATARLLDRLADV